MADSRLARARSGLCCPSGRERARAHRGRPPWWRLTRAIGAAVLGLVLPITALADHAPLASTSGAEIPQPDAQPADDHAKSDAGASKDTSLITAARHGRIALAEQLLAAGADVDAVDEHGADALLRGARHPGIVKRLLTAGADPRHMDDYGHTALMLAAATGAKESVRRLLEAGAELNARDKNGFTALDRARLARRENLADWLLARGAEEGTRRLRSPNPGVAAVRGGTARTDDRHWAQRLVIDDLRPPPEWIWQVRFWTEAAVIVGVSLLVVLAAARAHTARLGLQRALLPVLCLALGLWLTRWFYLASPSTLGSLVIGMVPLSLALVFIAGARQRAARLKNSVDSGWGLLAVLLLVGIWLTGYFWYRVGQGSWGMEGIPVFGVAIIAPWWLPLLLGLLVWSIGRAGRWMGATITVPGVGRLGLVALAAGWIGSSLQAAPTFGQFQQWADARFERLGLHEAAALTVTSELTRSRLYTVCQNSLAIPPDVDRFMAANVVHDGYTARLTVQIPFCTREQLDENPYLVADFRTASAKLIERDDVGRVVIEWILGNSGPMREEIQPRT